MVKNHDINILLIILLEILHYIHIATLAIFGLLVFPEYTIYKLIRMFKHKSGLQINFDENESDYIYESDNFKKVLFLDNTARVLNKKDTYSQLYRISIYNPSNIVTIKNVSAILTITYNCPNDLKREFPVPLHFTHDDIKPYKKTIDIPPLAREFVDVVMWQLLPKQVAPKLVIYHSIENLDITMPTYNNKQTYKIKIDVSGNSVKCISKYFFIGLKSGEMVFDRNWLHPVGLGGNQLH